MKSDFTIAVATATVVLLLCLATRPFGEMGINDDWHYAFIALEVAKTGRIAYTGCSAMLGIQAFWGAVWIRLFGFSFHLLRFSLLPFVAGCTVELYYLFRAAGVKTSLAAYGTAALMLSPLMLPLEVSFMTDIPALFFLLLCFLCCQRLIEASTRSEYSGWSILLFISGLAGGTIRQIVWLAPFVIFPLLALRKPRQGLQWFLWSTGIVCDASFSYWFHVQPYVSSLSGFSAQAMTRRWEMAPLLTYLNVSTLGIELISLMLPILCMSIRGKPIPKMRQLPLLDLASVIIIIGAVAAPTHGRLFAGNVITQWGILLSGTEILGQKPVVLPWVVECFVGVGAVSSLCVLTRSFVWPHRIQLSQLRDVFPGRSFAVSYGAFTVLYLCAIAPLTMTWSALDRYLVPVLPLAFALTLMALQNLGVRNISSLAVSCLSLFTMYGIATTHDYFARSRARLDAAQRVMDTGIARTHISAGLEFDGWTQLSTSGHINYFDAGNPAGSDIPPAQDYPTPDPFWMWPYTPSVKPEFVLSLSPVRGLSNSGFAAEQYRTWMPPFTGAILIQRADHISRKP